MFGVVLLNEKIRCTLAWDGKGGKMANVISWLMANWQPIVTAILAVDAALIPILPNVTLLQKIKSILSGVSAK